MPLFHYKAATTSGDVLEGEMEAVDRQDVVRKLQAQGHVPIRADAVRTTGSPAAREGWLRRRNVGRRDVELFTLELAALVRAGLAVDKGLDILVEIEPHGPRRDLLRGLQADVRGGTALSEALAKRSGLFSRFYVSMVRAGELSGAMDNALLANFLERARALRQEVGNALVYPIILVFIALFSMAIILGVVVPRISAMFEDSGQSLPWFTNIVIGAGNLMQQYGWIIGVAIAFVYLYARQFGNDPIVRKKWDGYLLGIPFLNTLVSEIEASRYMRTLGTLLENGVNLLDALEVSRQVVGNHEIASRLDRVSARVRQGEGLARPLMESRAFPSLASHLVRVGEETGSVDGMLLHLATIYENQVQTTTKRMVTLLGPILILGLAVFIAAIMFALVVPILSINDLALV